MPVYRVALAEVAKTISDAEANGETVTSIDDGNDEGEYVVVTAIRPHLGEMETRGGAA